MSAPYSISKVLADPRLRHAFYGREGGRSMGELASNNMSVGVGDNPDLVVSNRSSAAFAMGGHGVKDLIVLKQVHSTTVITMADRPIYGVAVEGDAMVTNRPDLLLGILTADCAPVLFADPETGIIAAAHAGWKGAAGGILSKTVAAMVALGTAPKNIRAAIGPTISGPNYEVGPDTAAQIVALDPAASAHITMPGAGAREHFDIPGLLAQQLLEAGVGLVGDLDLCTYAEPDRFFSHRYATHHGTTTGRQISIIGLA